MELLRSRHRMLTCSIVYDIGPFSFHEDEISFDGFFLGNPISQSMSLLPDQKWKLFSVIESDWVWSQGLVTTFEEALLIRETCPSVIPAPSLSFTTLSHVAACPRCIPQRAG